MQSELAYRLAEALAHDHHWASDSHPANPVIEHIKVGEIQIISVHYAPVLPLQQVAHGRRPQRTSRRKNRN